MSFSLLPPELQCSIIRLLDPIALIAISQTNTYFRRLVAPSHRHFTERLLGLELLMAHGGWGLAFDPVGGAPIFPKKGAGWTSKRWACTRCRRLLSHAHFDNHSITKLAYRKPPTVYSPNKLPATSWEPTWSLVYPPKSKKEAAKLRNNKLRRQYFLSTLSEESFMHLTVGGVVLASRDKLALLKMWDVDGFQNMTEADLLDMEYETIVRILHRMAKKLEPERAGYKRHLRKCLECRFRLGHLSRPPYGLASVPIVPSRQIEYNLNLDRWFPGFSARLDNQRPPTTPVIFRIQRSEPRSALYTLFIARCPVCSTWRELRDFRIGGIYQHWVPRIGSGLQAAAKTWTGSEMTDEVVGNAVCNACYARTHGREKLGEVLHEWADTLLRYELITASSRLQTPFGAWTDLRLRLPPAYRDEARAIIKEAPCLAADDWSPLTQADVTALHQAREQWKDMVSRIKMTYAPKKSSDIGGDEGAEEGGDDEAQWSWMMDRMELDHSTSYDLNDAEEWYNEWERFYTEWEILGTWLIKVRDELREKPWALVEWALDRPREGIHD